MGAGEIWNQTKLYACEEYPSGTERAVATPLTTKGDDTGSVRNWWRQTAVLIWEIYERQHLKTSLLKATFDSTRCPSQECAEEGQLEQGDKADQGLPLSGGLISCPRPRPARPHPPPPPCHQ